MIRRKLVSRHGFTLIELLVVITIIAILAALIVPALQRAQARAMAINCMGRARAIASAIRTYASNWDGWTNPDKDYFSKEFGYRLKTDPPYFAADGANWYDTTTSPPNASEVYQASVKEFRCPADAQPRTTNHGIKASYGVTSVFAGQNIMNLTTSASATLAVLENGSRHPAEGETLDGHYVYADLHATLGFSGNALPGLRMRAWNQASNAGIKGVPSSSVPAPLYDGVWGGDLEAVGYNWLRVLDKLSPNQDWDITYQINTFADRQGWGQGGAPGGGYTSSGMRFWRVCVRWDGGLSLPTNGTYQFWPYRDRDGHFRGTLEFSVGSGSLTNPTYGAFNIGNASAPTAFGFDYTGSAGKLVPFQMVFANDEWTGGWRMAWQVLNGATVVIPPEPIRAKYLFFIPL